MSEIAGAIPRNESTKPGSAGHQAGVNLPPPWGDGGGCAMLSIDRSRRGMALDQIQQSIREIVAMIHHVWILRCDCRLEKSHCLARPIARRLVTAGGSVARCRWISCPPPVDQLPAAGGGSVARRLATAATWWSWMTPRDGPGTTGRTEDLATVASPRASLWQPERL